MLIFSHYTWTYFRGTPTAKRFHFFICLLDRGQFRFRIRASVGRFYLWRRGELRPREEQRKKLLEMLQDAGIDDVAGVEELFKEMVGTVLQNSLEAELDE